MSYRHSLGLLTGGRAVPLPGDLDYVPPSRGASATDISTVITASTTAAAAILDAILGRTRTPATTPTPGPSDTGPALAPLPEPPSSNTWILPVAILGGAVLLGGIVILAVGGKKKAVAANRRRTRRNPTRAVRRRWLKEVEAGLRAGLLTKEEAKRFRDAAEADDPYAAMEALDAMERETKRRTQSNGRRVRRNGARRFDPLLGVRAESFGPGIEVHAREHGPREGYEVVTGGASGNWRTVKRFPATAKGERDAQALAASMATRLKTNRRGRRSQRVRRNAASPADTAKAKTIITRFFLAHKLELPQFIEPEDWTGPYSQGAVLVVMYDGNDSAKRALSLDGYDYALNEALQDALHRGGLFFEEGTTYYGGVYRI